MRNCCYPFAVVQCFIIVASFSSIECHQEHRNGNRRHLLSSTDRGGTPDPGEAGELAIKKAVKAYREKDVYERSALPIVVPVCFHTLYPTGGSPLTDEKLQIALDHLNKAFSSASCCDPALEWCTSSIVDNLCSVDTQITFELAELVNGTVTGDTTVGKLVDAANACVTRTENGGWFNHYRSVDERPMKEALYKGDPRVLNVYFVDLYVGSIGYATFPFNRNGNLDGIVVEFDTLPGDGGQFGEGDTMVQMAGLWLGLLHTFQGGCSSSDGILDTPKTRNPYYGCTPLFRRPDSCPDDGLDPIFNFMDFADDVCMYEFTAGQKEAMLAMWEYYRLGLGNVTTDIIQLQLGVPSEPITLFPRENQLYALKTNHCGVTCTVSGDDEGDVDMFMEFDKLPEFGVAHACFSQSIGNQESCSLYSSRRSIVRFVCGNRKRN